MTDRELLEQALEALDWLQHHLTQHHGCLHMDPTASGIPAWLGKTEAALRERLAQPQRTHWEGCEEVHPECRKPETVMAEYKFQTYAAYKTDGGEMKIGVVPDDAPLMLNGVPLYPRREWVGLTDEEIALVCGECAASAHRADDISYARAIEAKLREKNNG